MKRHWNVSDFVVTSENHSGGYGQQAGYCRKCGGDMQRFKASEEGVVPVIWGPLHHYNSHKKSGLNVKISTLSKQ